MIQRLLSLLAVTAVILIPTTAAHASTNPASNYIRSMIVPPGATAGATTDGGQINNVGNPINSEGDIGANAGFGQDNCGEGHAFVYFRKTHRYVVLGNPPGVGSADTEIIGIADDDSVGVIATLCSANQTYSDKKLIYRVASVDTTPHWSQPCACAGYYERFSYPGSPVGYNSDGVALNSHKTGPAVLTFPNGAPKISPLTTDAGPRAKAQIIAVGTPQGFVGLQYSPKLYKNVPTVWLDGKPHLLPVASNSGGVYIPFGMDERQTADGQRIGVVGTFNRHTGHGYTYYDGTDYWMGKPAPKGFAFTEERGFIRNSDMSKADGMSTNGWAIFGLNGYEEGLLVYYTASHKTAYGGLGCGTGYAWGDSHRDILIDSDAGALCLLQPKH